MAVNKVVINRNGVEDVLVDLTGDNVNPNALVVGHTTHDQTGEVIEGANPYAKAETDATVNAQTDLIQQIKTGLAEAEENIGRTNNEISTQSDIIQQIKTALEDKAAGGGVELPTLENEGSAEDLAQGKQLIGADGSVVTGNVVTVAENDLRSGRYSDPYYEDYTFFYTHRFAENTLFRKGSRYDAEVSTLDFGEAMPSDVRAGVKFASKYGIKTGEALMPGGGFVYPDGAFIPVTNFTAGKQYALVAVINGVRRYINTTTYNDYTMNATQITIGEDAGDYVIFSNTPVLFTAVASGDGFLLQNGSNYLHGTSSGGTALRFGTTQMVWTVNSSATGGFSDGKYYAKEDSNSVWLMNSSSGYNWSIKYETAGSFGYDREGRDNTYSTGFVSFVLYEYVAGEGELNPVVDSSDANVTADKMLAGYSGYANGRKVEGNIKLQSKTATASGTVTPDDGYLLSSVLVNVSSGSGGSVIKTGTTTSATIATGLSSIEEFFIYKETQTATGLIHLHYSKTGGTSYMYASAWSTNNYGTKTITNATTAPTISGGSITLPSSTATSGGLSSGVTYKWIAIGTE